MSISEIARGITFLLAGLIGVPVLVYVGASFALMRPYTESRPFGTVVREATRELGWSALIVALLPFWYLVGRRMGRVTGPSTNVPVIFVHGYTQNRVNFLRIARALSRVRRGPLCGFNYPWLADVGSNARRLSRYVDGVLRETGAQHVDLVCHSMGGLVALEMMRANGAARVRRCVTIATPHEGIPYKGPIPGACSAQLRTGSGFLAELAGAPLDVPCLSIYSTHDNIVHPPATASLARRGGKDAVVPHLAHLAILFSPTVADEVARFLGE